VVNYAENKKILVINYNYKKVFYNNSGWQLVLNEKKTEVK